MTTTDIIDNLNTYAKYDITRFAVCFFTRKDYHEDPTDSFWLDNKNEVSELKDYLEDISHEVYITGIDIDEQYQPSRDFYLSLVIYARELDAGEKSNITQEVIDAVLTNIVER